MKNESGRFIDKLRKPLTVALLVGLGAFSIAGCGEDSSDAREYFKGSPVQRIDFDFGGHTFNDGSMFDRVVAGGTCLEDTPYDPVITDGSTPSAIVTSQLNTRGQRIVSITPASDKYHDAQPLVLTGFEHFDHPLHGANQTSEAILHTYGCPTS